MSLSNAFLKICLIAIHVWNEKNILDMTVFDVARIFDSEEALSNALAKAAKQALDRIANAQLHVDRN